MLLDLVSFIPSSMLLIRIFKKTPWNYNLRNRELSGRISTHFNLLIHCISYQYCNALTFRSNSAGQLLMWWQELIVSWRPIVVWSPFGHTRQTKAHEGNVRIVVLCATCDFLATLVALHSTLVSDLVNAGFELVDLRSLRACFPSKRGTNYCTFCLFEYLPFERCCPR